MVQHLLSNLCHTKVRNNSRGSTREPIKTRVFAQGGAGAQIGGDCTASDCRCDAFRLAAGMATDVPLETQMTQALRPRLQTQLDATSGLQVVNRSANFR